MVTLTTARENIYQAWVTGWGGTSAFTFDNEQYDPPPDTPWVRVSVRHDGSVLEAIGGNGSGGVNQYQRSGRTFIQLFTPLNQGTRQIDGLAQTARNIFEGKTLATNAIRFYNVLIREIGPTDGWFQVNLEAAFQYDERK